MRQLIWICEACGTTWEQPANEPPLRDDHGRVICHPCLERARQAGAPSPLVLPDRLGGDP